MCFNYDDVLEFAGEIYWERIGRFMRRTEFFVSILLTHRKLVKDQIDRLQTPFDLKSTSKTNSMSTKIVLM